MRKHYAMLEKAGKGQVLGIGGMGQAFVVAGGDHDNLADDHWCFIVKAPLAGATRDSLRSADKAISHSSGS
jgi:hypothetical protein